MGAQINTHDVYLQWGGLYTLGAMRINDLKKLKIRKRNKRTSNSRIKQICNTIFRTFRYETGFHIQ